jgi:polyisoprenyl-teichoic acid--peptidoglycan teichoic acid transferase
LTDREHDERERAPEDQEQAGGKPEESPEGPAPATWAGRQRSSSEDAGEHDRLPEDDGGDAKAEAADEPPSAEEEASEPAAEPDGEGKGEDEEAEPGDGDEAAQPPADDDEEDGDTGPDTAERVAMDTVETDTLALGDREAAREAALAGLRARAAEHASKHGTEKITAPPPKKPTPADAQGDGHQPAQAPPAQPTPVAAAEAGEEEPRRRGLWLRFTAGSLLIIVAIALATALSLLFFVNGFIDKLHGIPGVQNELAVAHPGQPQTILIIGSDKRPHGQEVGHSDTTILVRVASDEITVLSIPRDLKVNIPNHGIDKFNAAFTIGGAKKTVQVVKQLTGITDINHVINVDFTGFADAVNAIGCVYVDVDQHYYHSNAGLAASEQYAEIDVPAGYQRMCGYNALQYVRYRHDDNDLVRSARQQEFLRELRQELPASRIAGQFNDLLDIFNKYVALDIKNPGDLIALGQLILGASNAPVVQVHFPANLGGPTAAYVTASQSAIKQAVAKFEGETPTPTTGAEPSGSESGGGGSGGAESGGGGGSGESSGAPAPPLIDATSSSQAVAAQLAATKTKSGKPMLDFPVYYPTKLAPGSAILTDQFGLEESRAFPIDGPGNEEYRGYKMVVSMPTDGYTGYYGVSGTDWKDPPILENPDETRTIDGRDYLLSWDGPQLRLIGWKTDQGSYWVDNTLLNVLTPGQMFAIAESMQKYTG